MANWSSAEDVTTKYQVGIERLLTYAHRGNLPMVATSNGSVMFDEDIVQLMFRPRNSPQLVPLANLGVLGESKLSPPPAGPHEVQPALTSRPEKSPRHVVLMRTGS